MDQTPPQAGDDRTTAELLRQVLAAVQERKGKRWVEITCAVVLSLATTASAWCAYQATLWSGVQTFKLAASNKANRDASSAQIVAVQARSFDGSMLISYLEARTRGDKALETLLHERFRPEMKKAVEAWLKSDPLHDPEGSPRIFQTPEYVQPELAQAQKHNDEADRLHAAAEHANETSDTYVMLTVLFASVLFFGGIGGSFDSPRMRAIVVVISMVLLAVTLVALETMPICKD